MGYRPERAIARVFNADGKAVGLAFAVDDQHLLTCAHVVNVALGRSLRDNTIPADQFLMVEFEFGGTGDAAARLTAKVVAWLPTNGIFDRHDAAKLRMATDLPTGVTPLQIGTQELLFPVPVQMWGPSSERQNAGHVLGRLVGGTEKHRYQIDQEQHGVFRVIQGFSGGPVWQQGSGDVVGILQASCVSDHEATDAYVLGIEVITNITNLSHEATLKNEIASPTISTKATLLHLPDLRFGEHHRFGLSGITKADQDTDTLANRLLQDLEVLREKYSLAPDLIVAAGDLTESGLPHQFETARQFLKFLAARIGLHLGRLLVIPGDHDINRRLAQAYVLTAEATGELAEPPYWPKWGPFAAMLGSLDGRVFLEDQPWTFQEIAELKVALVGLNSTMADSHLTDDHYGYLGERQLRTLAGQLQKVRHSGWLRIAVVHHGLTCPSGIGPTSGQLRDARQFEEILAGRVNLVLHGSCTAAGIDRVGTAAVPVIGTGSAGMTRSTGTTFSGEHPGSVVYRLVEIRQGRIRVWSRQYDFSRRRFVGDTSISEQGDDWYCDLPANV
jgi:3',5'-cyclic AMP phosphodiesterase CpdA